MCLVKNLGWMQFYMLCFMWWSAAVNIITSSAVLRRAPVFINPNRVQHLKHCFHLGTLHSGILVVSAVVDTKSAVLAAKDIRLSSVASQLVQPDPARPYRRTAALRPLQKHFQRMLVNTSPPSCACVDSHVLFSVNSWIEVAGSIDSIDRVLHRGPWANIVTALKWWIHLFTRKITDFSIRIWSVKSAFLNLLRGMELNMAVKLHFKIKISFTAK